MDTTVELTTLELTGSLPGPDSPLPVFRSLRALPPSEVDDADAAMNRRLSTGRLQHSLPYARQSDYRRSDDVLDIPALRLTNGVLTATVLPSLGGRVWSLQDHRRDRELLFVNPVLRFANLALTDAWFAGGIEWNLGTTGHTTLSSRPLHAARISTPTGDGIRLWEWERTRDLVLQVDLWLDDDRLHASTRVINPDPEPKPLYYWTNIAVPETPGTRVVAPARTAWRTDYSGSVRRVAVPFPDDTGLDLSHPHRSPRAVDYFFECDPPGRFVAAVEPDGHGFAQTATDELRGRKLFLWGTGHGGDRWQEWLSVPGARYAEIQAGWCTTQLEHDVIEGAGEVSWTECFGAVDTDPSDIAGDFTDAVDAVAVEVTRHASHDQLAARHSRWRTEVADAAPTQILWTASGWGAVECLLRDGAAVLPAKALPFPEVDDDSAPARALLADDSPRLRATASRLPIPPISPRWQHRFADPRWDGQPWVRYARAVSAHVDGDPVRAQEEYTASIELGGGIVGAERGLAVLAAERGDLEKARTHYAAAADLAPGERTLLTEHVEFLLDCDRPDDALAVLARAPESIRQHGRNRLLQGHALVRTGQRAAAIAVLAELEVEDLAEGSLDVHDLWQEVHPGAPVPPRSEFRMTTDTVS